MSIIRDITGEAILQLNSPEILIFVGARQVGKTTILKQIKEHLDGSGEKNVFFLHLEDVEYLELLNKSPKNLFKILPIDLKQRSYVFIDEIQYLNNPTNFLKYIYDQYGEKIKLIVSGSSAFYIDRKFKDSLAGRKKIYTIRTLSFLEFLRFKGEDELLKKDFLNLAHEDEFKISKNFHEYLVFGGYPRVVLASISEKENVLRELAFSYVKKDIFESGIKHEENFYKLFKILASQSGQLVNQLELAKTLGISKIAIENYLYVMRKSFHIGLLRPFHKNVRKELVKMPKVYFLDLGLRNFFANNLLPLLARDDRGLVLENGVYRQLLEKYDEEDLRFWRTADKKEIDFVVDEKTAFEVKMNGLKLKNSNVVAFEKAYSDIEINIATIDKKNSKAGDLKMLNIWEI